MGEVLTYKRLYDPSQTTGLRNSFAKEVSKGFNELSSVVFESIYINDCFGLNKVGVNQMEAAYIDRFSNMTSTEKIEAFLAWLLQQIDNGIIKEKQFQETWIDAYIKEAYIRGVQRARRDLKKNGIKVPDDISNILDPGTFHNEKEKILYLRAYNDLKAITNNLISITSQLLSQGLLSGTGSKRLALQILAMITGDNRELINIGKFVPMLQRGELFARSSIMRAFVEAQLQEFKNWGIKKVGVMAEILTAGDDKVCDRCASLEGKVYSIEEASGILPLHNDCRCIWVLTGIE